MKTNNHKPNESIATHFARALADGRYDDSQTLRRIKYGEHESRRPNDPLPKGIKFGGQIPMDDVLANAKIRDAGERAAPPLLRSPAFSASTG